MATMRAGVLTLMLAAAGACLAQGDPNAGALTPFDACGVLAQGYGCVLFEGGGGSYVLAEAGGFRFGDEVRVVGTLDPACITICEDADGCIRGAAIYDPAVYPCGSDLPDFPGDIISNVCAEVGATLVATALAGAWCTRRRVAR